MHADETTIQRSVTRNDSDMTVIDEIETRLKEYPEIRYEVGQNRICVPAASDQGFSVELVITRGSFTVSFAGWHEEFSDKDEAMNCFAFGLSRDCRLKVSRYGSFEYKWTVESIENGVWVEDSTTGLLTIPLCRTRYQYFQNDLIPGLRTPEE